MTQSLRSHGPVRDESRADVTKTVEGVAWALFVVWVGAAFIADLSWGVGFLGVGAITLGAQGVRKYFGLPADWFWLVIGIGWLVWGLLELLIAPGAASAPDTGPWGHPMRWPSFWWIFPLAFFVGMVVMVNFVMRGGMGRRWPRSESAEEILNRRYARGEIGKEEYEEKITAITRVRLR
jgi:putative membrane protein